MQSQSKPYEPIDIPTPKRKDVDDLIRRAAVDRKGS
jgi:hypothetical protein